MPFAIVSVIAFYASARGLQEGAAVPVIAATSTAANVSCILGGIIVFGDPMPADTLGIVLQGVAFLVLDLITPGRLGEHLMEKSFHPASLVRAAVQLAVAAIIVASIWP